MGPETCTVHFIDRGSGEHSETDCPLGIEPEYRMYFAEGAAEILFRQSAEAGE